MPLLSGGVMQTQRNREKITEKNRRRWIAKKPRLNMQMTVGAEVMIDV
jgi:hypothetical protein